MKDNSFSIPEKNSQSKAVKMYKFLDGPFSSQISE